MTGIAISTSWQLLILVTLRNDAGALLPPGTGSIQLNPSGHFSDTLLQERIALPGVYSDTLAKLRWALDTPSALWLRRGT